MAFAFATTMVASIAMARVLGPHKLGYFNYVMWLANMSGLVGSAGIPTTTRKYMAEYIGRGELGTARAVFFSTFRFQAAIALAITLLAVALVCFAGDPQYRTASLFQVISMLPSMAVFVPAQANAARENFRANVAASVVGSTIYFGAVVLSLVAGWGLIGIAIGILLSRTIEFFCRTVPVLAWIRSLPKGDVPEELKKRMFTFSGQTMVLMLLNVVVWDRSDMVFLKWLSKDISQVTFFAVAFNLSEKAMLFPQTFGTAVGASIMAQYGRDKSKLSSLVSGAARYMLLVSGPLLVGLACLSGPAISVLYGRQYVPAIPVLALVALLALPKTLLAPGHSLLQANEDQNFIIICGLLSGVVNVALDMLLIPHFNALGAAIGNGTAQALAVFGVWSRTVMMFNIRLDWKGLARIGMCVALMAVAVLTVRAVATPLIALVTGPIVGSAVYFLMLRRLSVIDGRDVSRIAPLLGSLPGRVRSTAIRGLSWLGPQSAEFELRELEPASKG